MKTRHEWLIHSLLITLLLLTMLPFVFVLNNSLRTNSEIYHAFFGLPAGLRQMAGFTWYKLSGQEEKIALREVQEEGDASRPAIRANQAPVRKMEYARAMNQLWSQLTRSYHYGWQTLRPYMLNTFLVCVSTLAGVLLLGSLSAFVFSRYRFLGRNTLFLIVLSLVMIPPVLTFVPSFLLVKQLGLLNSYAVLILPYVAGGQIFAMFLMKGFFDGLPEELFESARIDGAGYFAIYRHIVLPLSKQIFAVVAVMNILGTWNNFMWPFVTNADAKYHVVASGLYLMGQTQAATNISTMCAAYVLSSIPLLILFLYATRPFMQGVTSGAFKA